MQVRFKKLTDAAVMPRKAHPSDAGADLTAVSMEKDGDVVTYGTGLAVEIPEGHVGLLFPRSSVYKTYMTMTNCVGVIDAHYRGEVMVKFYGAGFHCYEVGDRIAQLIIMPYPEVEYVESDTLSATDRGEGGHGSTGR